MAYNRNQTIKRIEDILRNAQATQTEKIEQIADHFEIILISNEIYVK